MEEVVGEMGAGKEEGGDRGDEGRGEDEWGGL